MNALYRRLSLSSLALLLVLSACSEGDDPTGVERLPLDEDSSIALLAELMRTSTGLTHGILTDSGGKSSLAAADTSARPLSVTRSCPEGGSVMLEGSVRKALTEKGTGTVSLTVAQRPEGCRTQTPQGILAMDGEPEITVGGVYSLREEEPVEVRWSMTGHLRYRGAQSGRCDLEVRYRVDPRSRSGTVAGAVCGHPVDERF